MIVITASPFGRGGGCFFVFLEIFSNFVVSSELFRPADI